MNSSSPKLRPHGSDQPAAAAIFAALGSYTALLIAFWLAARYFRLAASLDHFPSAFASFSLLWAPYWMFGFGVAEVLRRLRPAWLRVLLPGVLVVPYLVFAIPRGGLRPEYVIIFVLLPVGLAALFTVAPRSEGLSLHDVLALLVIGIPVEFGLLRGAWPHAGLGSMPKLLLMDAALYAFLVVRATPNVGYDFRPRGRDLVIGIREWALYAPLAIVLGLALHFIRFHRYLPDASSIAAGWLITFFFVAVPEELFFRGLLQNLLEQSCTRPGASGQSHGLTNGARNKRSRWALLIASVVFGLSHFNKPLPFNWRYVIMAAIAGVFYGRA